MSKRKRNRTVVPMADKRALTELERIIPPFELNEFLMRQQQQEGDRWWRLASRYCHDDHRPRRTTLATMAVECGLSYGEIAMAWIREQHLDAILHAAKSVPKVLEDIAVDAMNTDVVCPKCDGEKQVVREEQKVTCPKCRGTGQILRHGDKDARQQFLEVNKLLGQNKGSGVQVNVNNQAAPALPPSMAEVMNQARAAVEGKSQPLLTEISEVTDAES